MNRSTPGLPIHHQLPEFTQTHVHWVSDAIWPFHRLCHFLLLPSIFPSIRSFPMTWLFTSSGQSIGASALALPVTSQGWFLLELIGLILQSKGLWRVFSSTTVQKHQFFGTQPALWSSSHIHTRPLEKPVVFDYLDLCWQSNVSAF